MSYIEQFVSSLQPVQKITLYDPSNPANVWVAKLNPKTITRKPGSVRKYVTTTNGTSVILGDREYPTTEIALTWTQMDAAERNALAAFTSIAPVVFVDNRNNGYLGVLVIDENEQLGNVTMDVWSVKASFLVIAPYHGSGISSNINALTPPTLSASLSETPGYMQSGTTVNIWSTVFTPCGESTVGPMLAITASAANKAYNVTFTAPASSYYRRTRLYWSTGVDYTQSTFLTDIESGFDASFLVQTGYVEYNTISPPLFGTAFTGFWTGGMWTEDD